MDNIELNSADEWAAGFIRRHPLYFLYDVLFASLPPKLSWRNKWRALKLFAAVYFGTPYRSADFE
jgi:hypothetical protein